MKQTIVTAPAVVGGSLIGGGALLAGVGATRIVEESLSLTIAGSSLITAGIIYLLSNVALTARQRITIGAVLTASGTTVAVLGTALGPNTTVLTLALIGGSQLTAGVIQVLQGATKREATHATAP